MFRSRLNQSGIAHIGMLLMAVIVLAGIGGAGYYVYQKNSVGEETTQVATDETVSDEEIDALTDDGSEVDNSPEHNKEVEIE